jgi:hypothetical protein
MKTIALLLALCSAGCAAAVGTTGSIYVPRDAAQTCASHCIDIGLALSSVVIMANNVGCVCSATPSQAPGAAAGGMAALMMAAQQQSSASRRRP